MVHVRRELNLCREEKWIDGETCYGLSTLVQQGYSQIIFAETLQEYSNQLRSERSKSELKHCFIATFNTSRLSSQTVKYTYHRRRCDYFLVINLVI